VTNCWNFGVEGHKEDKCTSKKASNAYQTISNQNQVRGNLTAPRKDEPDMKNIFGKL